MSVNNGLRKVLIIMWATEISLMLDTFVGIVQARIEQKCNLLSYIDNVKT